MEKPSFLSVCPWWRWWWWWWWR